jgi:hypothetical protein
LKPWYNRNCAGVPKKGYNHNRFVPLSLLVRPKIDHGYLTITSLVEQYHN